MPVPKKRKPRQRKNGRHHVQSQRQRLAAEEARREEHAQIVVKRAGDPRFVQRRKLPDGAAVLTWRADSDLGQAIQDALAAQREAFRAKFGREPRPEDPILFDPEADEPTPFDDRRWTGQMTRVAAAAEAIGLHPAYIEAWAEVGYVVTDANRHLFSAAQVDAYLQAVARHMEADPPAEYPTDGPPLSTAMLADELRDVAADIVTRHDPRPAWNLIKLMRGVDDVELRELLPGAATAMLLSGLTEVRAQIGPDGAVRAVTWVRDHLGQHEADLAVTAAGVLRHPAAPRLTLNQVANRLGEALLPALLWLTAGTLVISEGPGSAPTA